MSAIMKMKDVSPEILIKMHWAKGFAAWKPTLLRALKASALATCRGRRPWQVTELFVSELGRASLLLNKCIQSVEEASWKHGVEAGLSHLNP